jgi:hypothetical protein
MKLLVPYAGRSLGVWKDSFNSHLSAMRQCVERSFAILTQRWGILWRLATSDQSDANSINGLYYLLF